MSGAHSRPGTEAALADYECDERCRAQLAIFTRGRSLLIASMCEGSVSQLSASTPTQTIVSVRSCGAFVDVGPCRSLARLMTMNIARITGVLSQAVE